MPVSKPADLPPPAPDLDTGLRGLVGYNLKRAAHLVQSDAARVLDSFGLRLTTYSALVVICDSPDVSQSRLAEALGLERSNTVVIIDMLEQAGLIGRHPVPTDRRAYALRATLKGRRLRDKAALALAAHEDAMLAGLGPQDRAQLIDLLQRIGPQR